MAGATTASQVPGSRPLDGLRVVELAVGTSELGLGLASGVPGMVFADLGAEVTRVVGTRAPDIDRHHSWGRAWHRDKTIVRTDDPDEIRHHLAAADVALVHGSEADVEQRGLDQVALAAANPRLVYVRCRPSRTAAGSVDDYALLVEARTGFCTQLAGHRDGPIFVDARAAGSGAAFLMTTSALALLRERALTGRGGWAETSLYDGMLATLGCMIGRSECAPPEVEGYWERGSTFPNFLYRCGDGELIQVWFGGKGMYDRLIEVLGDEPSTQGYYQDQATGQLRVRAERWRELFMAEARDTWIERLRAVGVAAEPVHGPGEALREAHLAEIGLALGRSDGDHRDLVVGTPIEIGPLSVHGPTRGDDVEPPPAGRGDLLAGVKVADFSAFVAGPLAAEVLADLGADVIKVEPPGGEAMRGAAYAIAACQRGKRSLAIDVNAPEARPVIDALLGWADVVLHNFRVGVSDRLGIDEETVAAANPGAVYCHASAFGPRGPRATMPGNDALMQALTGFERAIGGDGNDPTAATWIPIDMSGGWVSAAGILAALYARTTTGEGQRVATSLLGAGMLLHSGVFVRDNEVVRGPRLAADQTGYGPGYRIFAAADGWLAVVVPSADAWAGLRSLPGLGDLSSDYVPLRTGDADDPARAAERLLEAAIADGAVAEWVERLRSVGALVEPVVEMDRDEFRRGILDDPVNRQLGRVASYRTDDWGAFEQIGPLLRTGPAAGDGPPLHLPGIGQHSAVVMRDLGIDESLITRLIDAKTVTQP